MTSGHRLARDRNILFTAFENIHGVINWIQSDTDRSRLQRNCRAPLTRDAVGISTSRRNTKPILVNSVATLCRSSRPALRPVFIGALLSSALFATAQEAAPSQDQVASQMSAGANKAIGEIKSLPECSLSKTNNACRVTIDRKHLVSPPTVQMYSGQYIAVVVENPYPFERYFLDFASGIATLKPDVASSIVQGLLPSLQKLGEFTTKSFDMSDRATDVCANMKDMPKVDPGKVDDAVQVAKICVEQLARRDIDIYRKLEPLVAPDSTIPVGTAIPALPCELTACISGFVDSENIFSTKVSEILADTNLKTSTDPDKKESDEIAMGKLAALQKLADAVATDLQGYRQRLEDLPTNAELTSWGVVNCKQLINIDDKINIQCLALKSNADAEGVYQNMVTRTVSYSLNALNLVSSSQEAVPDASKKKLLATIALNFAESPKSGSLALRWEASAGAFFSFLPVRSFSVAPVFTNGLITDKKISENVLHPTVVPFAAANYRLTNDLRWTRWKSNLYWTGAIGINPNTVSADFGTGLSLSWRGLIVSALSHFGHDVRLTQGLTVGESLGSQFNGSLSTSTYWTPNFALGFGIRVPSLTGR
jgi:hypothetical protein